MSGELARAVKAWLDINEETPPEHDPAYLWALEAHGDLRAGLRHMIAVKSDEAVPIPQRGKDG